MASDKGQSALDAFRYIIQLESVSNARISCNCIQITSLKQTYLFSTERSSDGLEYNSACNKATFSIKTLQTPLQDMHELIAWKFFFTYIASVTALARAKLNLCHDTAFSIFQADYLILEVITCEIK